MCVGAMENFMWMREAHVNVIEGNDMSAGYERMKVQCLLHVDVKIINCDFIFVWIRREKYILKGIVFNSNGC